MAKLDLKALARHGAVARIAELSAEINAIYRMFPDLRGGRRGSRKAAAGAEPVTAGRRRGRKPMTAAQRKAVGERMTKYWAERRRKKGKS